MKSTVGSWLLVAIVVAVTASSPASAQRAKAKPILDDCASWSIDGYTIGMRTDEILDIRSVTIHVEGQAQVVVPGSFSGVLTLDPSRRLEKWDVQYQAADGEALRALMQRLHDAPVSDVSGNVIDNDSDTVRQRRTIWQSTACDAAIIVYETTGVRGTSTHSVSASLVRASSLDPGFVEMKTLFH